MLAQVLSTALWWVWWPLGVACRPRFLAKPQKESEIELELKRNRRRLNYRGAQQANPLLSTMRKAHRTSFSHRRPSASPPDPPSTLSSLHIPTPDASHLGDDDAPLRSPQVPATLAHLTDDLERSSRVKDSISSARAELVALRDEVLAMSGGRGPRSKRRIRRVDPFDIDYALIAGGARRGSSGIGGDDGVRPAWVTASEDGDPYAHQEEEIFVAVGIEELQKHKKVQMAALRMYVEKEFIPRPPPPKKDKPRGVRRQRQMIGGKSHKIIPESAYGQLLLSQMEKSKIPRPYLRPKSTDVVVGGGSGGGGELSRQTAVDKADAAMDKRRYLEREALAETKRVEQEIRRRIALTHLKRQPNVVDVVGVETKRGGGEERRWSEETEMGRRELAALCIVTCVGVWVYC